MQKKIVSVLYASLLGLGLMGCDQADEKVTKDDSKTPSVAIKEVKDGWTDYKIAGDFFVVRVPAKPECQEHPAGKGLVAHLCTTETEETGMMINASKMPGVVDPGKISMALDSSMKGSAKSMSGEAVDVTDIEIGGYKGKDFTIKTEQGTIRSRMVIKADYLVQVVAMPKTTASDTTKEESEKFIKSLAAAKQS